MKLFITGTGTDVGKTIASAIITEALQADYWKPIQAGDLHDADSHKIQRYISNAVTRIFPNSYALNTPASPHLAAAIDNVDIDLKSMAEPETKNHLVIEGAGGILVPLNDTDVVANMIRPGHKVIVVSRNYLGSINHTLMTLEVLKGRGITVAGIIFNGNENLATENIILEKTGVKLIGRIENEPYFDKNVVLDYADRFRENLLNI
ncbi:dethiobiotin synthase [uncultured Flavobacterium sp.]|uniref:dethiobiotin synthase n=1 Tax=uncultured Flavobacterium sp. TaxID=165435 RepID=UPI0025CD0F82|nr:dethiobiotin synthase [uncultured Flavobacterium sp.]